LQVGPEEKASLRSELMASSGITERFEAKFDNESYFKVA